MAAKRIMYLYSIRVPVKANALPRMQVTSHAHTLQSSLGSKLSASAVLTVSKMATTKHAVDNKMAKLRSFRTNPGMGLPEMALMIKELSSVKAGCDSVWFARLLSKRGYWVASFCSYSSGNISLEFFPLMWEMDILQVVRKSLVFKALFNIIIFC